MIVVCLLGLVILVLGASVMLPSKQLGKFIFELNSFIECKLARLKKHQFVYQNFTVSYYDNHQSGPVLLLLHGLSSDKSIWRRFAIQCREDYRVIIPDLPGHGETNFSYNYRYSTRNYADLCITLMRDLNINEYTVIGNSMGGAIAVFVQKQVPAECTNKVLISPAGARTDMTLHMLRENYNPFLHKDTESVKEIYDLVMYNKPFLPTSTFHYLADRFYLRRYHQLSQIFQDVVDEKTLLDSNSQVGSQNTLIIWGEEDKFTPLSDLKTWRSIVGGRYLVYPETGHMPMYERPQQTYNDIRLFLNAEPTSNQAS